MSQINSWYVQCNELYTEHAIKRIKKLKTLGLKGEIMLSKLLQKSTVKNKENNTLQIDIPVNDFRSLPIPGVDSARLGVTYVRVIDIPDALDKYMEINPRVPNRNKAGLLNGPIIQGILSTLRDNPEEMAIKNQGIYLLVNSVDFRRNKDENGILTISFNDKGKHGIINGGHTYAAIREAIESASDEETKALQNAYVRLHIFQGIDEDYVSEIAEGLNRSKQVDDPSLVNLQGEFDIIKKVMHGKLGEKAIAYHQGDAGQVYISELLVILSMFNTERFDERKHPNNLYSKNALGLKYFSEDMQSSKLVVRSLVENLPDFLWLADSIKKLTPQAAKKNAFKFGLAKVVGGERAGGKKAKGTELPFIGEKMDYRVPNGWVYPMLASFRANLKWNGKSYEWRMPLKQILPEIIDELVGICVVEHRDNNMRPELIGKRESAYRQCYTRIQLYLAKKNLLN